MNAFATSLRWSVRRELWQNHSLWIGPVIAGAILAASFIVGLIAAPSRVSSYLMTSVAGGDPIGIARPFSYVAAMVAVGAFIVGVFYCIDAIQGERLDRSILFWKSMPVSDTTTILAKASVPLIVLPIVVVLVSLVVHAILLVVGTIALATTGGDPAALWGAIPFARLGLDLLGGMAIMTALHAPIYAWLILVSAWSRRRAVLWAFLPPLALVAAEQTLLETSRAKAWLASLVLDPFTRAFVLDRHKGPLPILDDRFPNVDFAAVFAHSGVWTGLLLTAVFLFVAIRLRRDRELV